MKEALLHKGFSVVEVISPCPTLFGRMNRQPTGREILDYYHENSIIRHGADPATVGIELGGEIVVGKFLDVDKPTFEDHYWALYGAKA